MCTLQLQGEKKKIQTGYLVKVDEPGCWLTYNEFVLFGIGDSLTAQPSLVVFCNMALDWLVKVSLHNHKQITENCILKNDELQLLLGYFKV